MTIRDTTGARTTEATVTLRGRTMAGMAAVMVDRTMAGGYVYGGPSFSIAGGGYRRW